MDTTIMYPKECRRNLKRLKSATGVSEELLYAMMLTTAALMDLRPEDNEVAEMILEDTGIYPDKIA